MIEITEVRILKINTGNRVKGVASITINNCFVVNDIRLIESSNGLFIAMPSKKNVNGEFKDIAFPINNETREIIQNAIIEKYKEIN